MHGTRLAAVAIIATAALWSTSCATVPPSQREDSVGSVLELLESGQAEGLVDHSATPFLLDGEILVAEGDLVELWTLLSTRDFAFASPVITAIQPVDESSFSLFADSMEVRVFFERYLPEDAAVAEIQSGSQRYRFLFGGESARDSSLPRMYGWKGPL